jgi:hypothetical protein
MYEAPNFTIFHPSDVSSYLLDPNMFSTHFHHPSLYSTLDTIHSVV